jgi:hypothetical protein
MPPSVTWPRPRPSTNPTSAASCVTLLSPTIIEAILEGRQPATLELDDLLKQFPIEWDNQLEMLTES